MRITGTVIDCVYDSTLSQTRVMLPTKLPDMRIARLASILVIDTVDGMHVVKIRRPAFKQNGTVDAERTHQRILESDYIELTMNDFKSCKDF